MTTNDPVNHPQHYTAHPWDEWTRNAFDEWTHSARQAIEKTTQEQEAH